MVIASHKGAQCVTKQISCFRENHGAGEGIRTLDLNLGKVALYH